MKIVYDYYPLLSCFHVASHHVLSISEIEGIPCDASKDYINKLLVLPSCSDITQECMPRHHCEAHCPAWGECLAPAQNVEGLSSL